ncbi:MAG: hypothetical protein IH859_00685, partial [Chloroflexi bacterium]|nr:hypothetical protein [Chloroflexota bacterium]
MASNVAAMLILALLLSVITLMARSTIVSSGVMDRATRAALDRAASRAKTNFSIESVTVFGLALHTKHLTRDSPEAQRQSGIGRVDRDKPPG